MGKMMMMMIDYDDDDFDYDDDKYDQCFDDCHVEGYFN